MFEPMATSSYATENQTLTKNPPAPGGKMHANTEGQGQPRLLVVDFARVLAILFMIQ
jgi:hypothetical protein